MGPTLKGAGGSGSGFFQPVGENRLGMCCGPAAGQHLLQTRVVCIEAEQKVAHVDPGFDPVTLRTCEDGVQHGGSPTATRAGLYRVADRVASHNLFLDNSLSRSPCNFQAALAIPNSRPARQVAVPSRVSPECCAPALKHTRPGKYGFAGRLLI